MENYIALLVNTFLVSVFNTYCWEKLHINKQQEKHKFNYVMITTFSMSATYISTLIFTQPFRLIIVFLLFITINYFLVSREIKKSIISVVLSQMILAVAETSFVVIFSIFFDNKIYELLLKPNLSILLNIYILVVSILIVNRKFTKYLYLLFYNNINKNSRKLQQNKQ